MPGNDKYDRSNMSALQEAKEVLALVEDKLPFRVNSVTVENAPGEVIGTLRDRNGSPFLTPHPESVSMLTADREVFDFFTKVGTVLKNLIDEVERPQTANKMSSDA